MNQPPAPIGFYFDFISPFGYFASLRIDELAARHGRATDWNAMLIGVSVLKVMGLKPILEIPLNGDYVRHDGARYARPHSIRLGRPLDGPPANPLPAGRGFCWLKQRDPAAARHYSRAVLHAYWIDNADISTPAAVAVIAAGAGLDATELEGAVAGKGAALLLRNSVEGSLVLGVFGSPFILVDGEPFFGVEKMVLLEDRLRSDGW
jgi:2-hydroxychromene-2-carboxylate isomerase